MEAGWSGAQESSSDPLPVMTARTLLILSPDYYAHHRNLTTLRHHLSTKSKQHKYSINWIRAKKCYAFVWWQAEADTLSINLIEF